MESIPISEEDLRFLETRAAALELTVPELVEQLILRERILAKAKPIAVDPPNPHTEPPHRKWGM